MYGVTANGMCFLVMKIQGGSNMTGTDCLEFTHKKSRSYLNHVVFPSPCNESQLGALFTLSLFLQSTLYMFRAFL